jgi:hypothetical protein
MTRLPISLQDLRRRIYVAAKADFGWKRWSTVWLHERLGSAEITEFAIGARPKALPVGRSHNP